MWVQARPQGRRIRILATRDKARVVTARSPQGNFSQENMDAASRLAVQAIRAIPELRWAAVDVLIRPTRILQGRSDGLLVEGLSSAPYFTEHHMVLAGDFDQFCRSIIETAEDGYSSDVNHESSEHWAPPHAWV